MAKTFIELNYCVESWKNVNNKCKLTFPSGEKVGLPGKCNKYTKVNGCTDSAQLQMTVNDYNLMMGITANMLGFTLVFLVGFLFILQGRR
jgi:hypothetical protein